MRGVLLAIAVAMAGCGGALSGGYPDPLCNAVEQTGVSLQFRSFGDIRFQVGMTRNEVYEEIQRSRRPARPRTGEEEADDSGLQITGPSERELESDNWLLSVLAGDGNRFNPEDGVILRFLFRDDKLFAIFELPWPMP